MPLYKVGAGVNLIEIIGVVVRIILTAFRPAFRKLVNLLCDCRSYRLSKVIGSVGKYMTCIF